MSYRLINANEIAEKYPVVNEMECIYADLPNGLDGKHYTLVDNKPCALVDTVSMMASADYKERFKAEYYQLKIRYQKLQNILDKWDNGELDFEPTCPRCIYDRQIQGMEVYLDTLVDRAELENIEL